MTQIIQSGKCLKERSGELPIKFPKKFNQIPNVVITAFWENQGSGVSHVETIDSISTSGFRVVSDNSAPNYYVSWIAIGE